MKQRVIIMGGGFAGLAAARRFKRELRKIEVVLIDKRTHHNFLPLLPDLIGRDFNGDNLCYSLALAALRWGFRFLNSRVNAVDLEQQVVSTDSGDLGFDFLVIATGSETNFFKSINLRQNAYTLESVADAIALRNAIWAGPGKNIVICGGGYTGVELASAVWLASKRHYLTNNIILVNIGHALCTSLPKQFQEFIRENLEGLGIEVKLGTTVRTITNRQVCLENGEVINKAMLVWVAGRRTHDFVQELHPDKNRQGRLLVDPYLRIGKKIFAAGDVASFVHGAGNLRMSVQFSRDEGHCAAENISRHINGRPLIPFQPRDPGYVVPMANGVSCGKVFGRDLFGRIPTGLHYAMSAYKSYGLKNRYQILRDWISSWRFNPEDKFKLHNRGK